MSIKAAQEVFWSVSAPGVGREGSLKGLKYLCVEVGGWWVVFFGAKYPGDLFPPTPLPGLSQEPAE